MGWFGGKETEWGVRFGRKETWGYSSRSKAEAACKRMNKGAKGGDRAKVIQRTMPKSPRAKAKLQDKCVGGKCKANGLTCKKHQRKFGGPEYELYDRQGRNKNTIRPDGKQA